VLLEGSMRVRRTSALQGGVEGVLGGEELLAAGVVAADQVLRRQQAAHDVSVALLTGKAHDRVAVGLQSTQGCVGPVA
jgi:hypothetical protein